MVFHFSTRTLGDAEWWYRNLGIFRSSNAPVLLINEDVQGKICFVDKPNVSQIEFGAIQLLQRSVRERLVCIYTSSAKRMVSPNPARKQLEVMVYDTVLEDVSWSSISCNTVQGNQKPLLKYFLNEFNIRLCSCLTELPNASIMTILNIPSPMKFLKQRIMFFFRSFVSLNILQKLRPVSTIVQSCW